MPLHDTTCGSGFDGETWTFELIELGKYHLLSRWAPESCGTSSTIHLAQVGLRIREMSRLDKVLTALGERKSEKKVIIGRCLIKVACNVRAWRSADILCYFSPELLLSKDISLNLYSKAQLYSSSPD